MICACLEKLNTEIDSHPLAIYMSDISEDCYAAGWLSGTEYVLWQAVLNGFTKSGCWVVTYENIAELKKLSTQYQCWIYWLEGVGTIPVSLGCWEQLYSVWKGGHR